jgi:AcrR family transcriptional regulator
MVTELETSSLSTRQQAGREEILRAAAEAFTTRGYAATSIDDIADRLQSTKGRVYHYFKTKGDIFLEVHRSAMERVINAAAPIATGEGTAAERLRRMVVTQARLLMTEYSLMRAAAHHAEVSLVTEGRTTEKALLEVIELRDVFESLFRGVIAEGMATGEFERRNAGLMVKAVLGAVNWISLWYHPGATGEHGSVDDIADEFGDFVLGGLGVQRTRST